MLNLRNIHIPYLKKKIIWDEFNKLLKFVIENYLYRLDKKQFQHLPTNCILIF